MTTQRIHPSTLRRIRNEIPIRDLIADRLDIPCKWTDDVFRFLCPVCGDFHTASNPRTNLGRCFRCRRNFNPNDITIAVRGCSFLEAVDILRAALP